MTGPTAPPPEIDGLTYQEFLGSGGYSDVFLYERQRPRMQVAVKVLNATELSDAEIAQFTEEAESMAQLAGHPNIVQVFLTDTTRDGRPYLVMKYYPPPNLAARAAKERFSVAEVLRTGIKVASAVETAHRAGILHRDIKPANILVSQYGEPGLADFGIAGSIVDAATGDSDADLGVSIPWSPPEMLNGSSNGSVASDVYSLAATLWHLLAGRSPYEVSRSGDNSPRALIGRILKAVPPPTGRADAPASLDRLLAQAMSKQPEMRPASALELARSLQAIEQERRYNRTEIVVEGAVETPFVAPSEPRPPAKSDRAASRDSWAPPPDRSASPFRESAPATQRRPLVPEPVQSSIPVVPAAARPESAAPPAPVAPVVGDGPPARPAPPIGVRPAAEAPTGAKIAPLSPELPAAGTRRRPESAPAAKDRAATKTERPQATASTASEGRPRRQRSGAVAEPATTLRPSVPTDDTPAPSTARDRSLRPATLIGAAALVIVAAVVVGVVVLSSGGKNQRIDKPTTPIGNDQGGFGGAAAQAPAVSASYDAPSKTVTFRWVEPSAASGSVTHFMYSIAGAQPVGPTTETQTQVVTDSPQSVCISVAAIGGDGTPKYAGDVCGS